MITQPVMEDEGIFTPKQRYPLVIHFGGDKKLFDLLKQQHRNPEALKTAANTPAVTGYWFIGDESLGVTEPAPESGWERFTRTNNDNTETNGYATQNIHIAVCRMRRVREIKKQYKDLGLPQKHGWYVKMSEVQKGKYQTRLQILGLVSGLEHLGPVVVTFKTNAVKQLLGDTREKNPGILNVLDDGVGAESLFYKHVIAQASKEAGAPIPYSYYWLSLEHAMDKNGIPLFEEIPYGDKGDNAYVCPVTWHGIETTWHMLKLDEEQRGMVDAIRIDPKTKEWAAAWSGNNLNALNNELAQDAGEGEEMEGANYVPPAPPMEETIVDENGEVVLPLTEKPKKDPTAIPGIVKGAANLKPSVSPERTAKVIANLKNLEANYLERDGQLSLADKNKRITEVKETISNTALGANPDLQALFVRTHFEDTISGGWNELSGEQLGAVMTAVLSKNFQPYLNDWVAANK